MNADYEGLVANLLKSRLALLHNLFGLTVQEKSVTGRMKLVDNLELNDSSAMLFRHGIQSVLAQC